MTVADVLDELLQVLVLGIYMSALVDPGKKGGSPVGSSLNGNATGAHGDKSRKVVVDRAKAVIDPGPHGWTRKDGIPAVEHHEGRLVVGHVGMHGTDDAKVVRMFPKMMKDLADGDPALPVLLEGEGRGEGPTGLAFGLEVDGNSLARIFPQGGLGVKSIDLGSSTVAEDVNDVLGLGMKMGGTGWTGAEQSKPREALCL